MRGMRGRLVCTCVPQQFVKNFERIVARLFAYGLQMPHITLQRVGYYSLNTVLVVREGCLGYVYLFFYLIIYLID